MKKIFAVLLLCVAVSSLYAQKNDASVTGHIIDKKTGEHIPFATIVVNDGQLYTTSDETGHFMLTNVPNGIHVFKATLVGYQEHNQTVTIHKPDTYVVHFYLSPDEQMLEEVVVTGNRYVTKKRETGNIVNLVTPKKFETTASVTPAEILNFQPGLRVEYDCGNCGVPQLRINGLSGQYSQVLLDSRAIFSSLGMVYGLEQLPASMIERVEVVRGGGSALFGSNAIGGTVNIITKEPTSSLLQLSNQTGLIGGESLDANTSLNGSFISGDGRTGAYLFSMIRSRDGYDNNDDGYTDIPKLRSETVGVRAFQKIGERQKLTLEYHHIHEFRRGGDSLDIPAHESNLAEQLEHQINGGGLTYDVYSADDKNSGSVYVSMQHIGRNSYFGTGKNPDAYGRTKDYTLNAGAQWIHDFQNETLPAIFTAGFDYTYDKLEDVMIGYNREIAQQTHVGGIYAQNEWKNVRYGILLGLRADKHSMIKSPIISPRVTLRYAPTKDITLRASYARGYRAPQIYDEDLHVGAVGGEVSLIHMSPDLVPEYSNSANLSFDYWKQIGQWQINLLLEGFYTDLENVFALVETGHDSQGNLLLERVNEDGARVGGFNAEARIAYGKVFNLQGGYTFQKSKYKTPFKWSDDVEAQTTMYNSPDHYGYVNIDYIPVEPLTLSLNSIFTGPMLFQHYAGWVDKDCEKVTPTFTDLSFRVAYKVNITRKNQMEIFGSVKNILNQYQDDLDVGMDKDSKYVYGPATPRSYYFGIKFVF